MNPTSPVVSAPRGSPRLDYLDATRAFALLLGVVFHASLSFMPVFIGWAVQDISTSPVVGNVFTVSHCFRMATFFLLAGYFGRVTFHRRGAWDFLRSRATRIAVPFIVGWFVLQPLVSSGWIMGFASMRGDYDFWAAVRAGFASLSSLPDGLFLRTHLWFLYYLILITALTLALRQLWAATGTSGERLKARIDASIAWLTHSRWKFPLLIIPTAWLLSLMTIWGVDTPDSSLYPHWPVLTIYGGFFGFGWLIARQPATLAGLARLSAEHGIAAALGVTIILVLSPIQMDPGHAQYATAHHLFVVGYALSMWSLVCLTLGVFKRCCQRPRAWVRYVADSSYWMYLIHLPIVVWLQVAVAEWPLHWSLKLVLISVATVSISLVTYDLFVRSTWLGALLNGRRRDRAVTTWMSSQPLESVPSS